MPTPREKFEKLAKKCQDCPNCSITIDFETSICGIGCWGKNKPKK